MATDKELELGKKIFEDMCQGLDAQDWHYDRIDEDMVVKIGMRSDDLPIEMILRVNATAQVVSVFSILPVKVPEDKIVEMAMAVSVANHNLVNGCFDLDIQNRKIVWRLASTYRGSLLGNEAYSYMVGVSAGTIDQYNDRFLMLSKNMIDLEKFIELDSAN